MQHSCCLRKTLALPVQNWHSIHPFLPLFFHPRLLGIINSHKTPAARNVTGSMSGSITLLPLLLPLLHTEGLVFPLRMVVIGCNKMETVDCEVRAIHLEMPTYIASCLAPASTNQYSYTSTGPGHPATPATGYQWIGWTSHYRPTNSTGLTSEL